MVVSFLTWIAFLYVSRSKTELGNVISNSDFHGGATTMFCELVILNIVYPSLILPSLLAIAPSVYNRSFWNIYLYLFSFSLPILLCCFNLVPINSNALKLLFLRSVTTKSSGHVLFFFTPNLWELVNFSSLASSSVISSLPSFPSVFLSLAFFQDPSFSTQFIIL